MQGKMEESMRNKKKEDKVNLLEALGMEEKTKILAFKKRKITNQGNIPNWKGRVSECARWNRFFRITVDDFII